MIRTIVAVALVVTLAAPAYAKKDDSPPPHVPPGYCVEPGMTYPPKLVLCPKPPRPPQPPIAPAKAPAKPHR